jgi:holo-[acyl-carrier protein] synthase
LENGIAAGREFSDGGLAIGVDLVEVRRVAALVARYGERFTGRVFSPAELSDCGGRVESLAARWAAKEAVVKALETGFGPVAFRDIELLRGYAGRPELRLDGQARTLAEARGLRSWAVSLSHDGSYAIAFVVARSGSDSRSG